jgi:hypothetical protein
MPHGLGPMSHKRGANSPSRAIRCMCMKLVLVPCAGALVCQRSKHHGNGAGGHVQERASVPAYQCVLVCWRASVRSTRVLACHLQQCASVPVYRRTSAQACAQQRAGARETDTVQAEKS